MTMLLAWKTELSRFAGGLQPAEIRSAVLLGLIGLVIYPVLPKHAIDPWGLLNPSDAWISVIAIAGIGFTNYVLLRLYSTSGLYFAAVFGGLVNSTATVAELSSRLKERESSPKLTSLCLVATIAMFARNLVLAALFSPATLSATLVPLLAMTLVAGVWVWRDELGRSDVPAAPLTLSSPIALGKVLRFGAVFVVVQVTGALLTRAMGNPGLFIVALVGGLVSSASTTAAAATMAMHGEISPAAAGSATVLASVASVLINFPIVWRLTKDRGIARRLGFELATVVAAGVLSVAIDRIFQLSELVQR
jgi:uncharacterized membrane protein (DUF4010 family)